MQTWRRRLKGGLPFVVMGVLWMLACTSIDANPPARNTPPAKQTQTPPKHKPGWWNDAVAYEIFVRSFKDSNGDGVGDLKGLISKLDYLNDGNPATTTDLGVNLLWLMPIFKSPSYHGYDTVDYKTIQPAYGTNADFQLLLKEAHKRGIKVIVDLVINHTSSKHPRFVDSSKGAKSQYRDWYVWRKDNPGWTQPWGSGSVWHPRGGNFFYGIFWQGMPDLNYRNAAVQKWAVDLSKHWLKQGVDGFRIDAARYIVANGAGNKQSDQLETLNFWRKYRKEVKTAYPKSMIVGEVWTSAPNIAKYCKGDQFDLAFNFPLADGIFNSVSAMSSKAFWKSWTGSKVIDPVCMAPFLSNHDTERIFSRFNGDAAMMRLAAALLLTVPGTPFLYYGEEIGLVQGKQKGDEAKRTPMPWDATAKGGFSTGTAWTTMVPHKTANVKTQSANARSLLSLYRRLIRLRTKEVSLRRGVMKPVEVKGSHAVLAFIREVGNSRTLVVLNLNDEKQDKVTLTLPFKAPNVPRLLLEDKAATMGSPKSVQSATSTTYTFNFPAYAVAVYRL